MFLKIQEMTKFDIGLTIVVLAIIFILFIYGIIYDKKRRKKRLGDTDTLKSFKRRMSRGDDIDNIYE